MNDNHMTPRKELFVETIKFQAACKTKRSLIEEGKLEADPQVALMETLIQTSIANMKTILAEM